MCVWVSVCVWRVGCSGFWWFKKRLMTVEGSGDDITNTAHKPLGAHGTE